MIIAEQKKKENIVEYLLYMWQIEDIIRSLNFDKSLIKESIVDSFEVDEATRIKIQKWYDALVDQMRSEEIQEQGHLSFIHDLIAELEFLHQTLLTTLQDKKYIAVYDDAKQHITFLMAKAEHKKQNDVHTCLVALYGVLMLRLKKKQVSDSTEEAIKSISKLMAMLSLKYKELYSGKLDFSSESKN
jgi:hypothetical protein